MVAFFFARAGAMADGSRDGLLQLQGSLGGDCVVHRRIPAGCGGGSWRHKPLVANGLRFGATTDGNHRRKGCGSGGEAANVEVALKVPSMANRWPPAVAGERRFDGWKFQQGGLVLRQQLEVVHI